MSPKISKITQQKPREVFPFFLILTIQLTVLFFIITYYYYYVIKLHVTALKG